MWNFCIGDTQEDLDLPADSDRICLSKPGEIRWRKAIGPVIWQPVAIFQYEDVTQQVNKLISSKITVSWQLEREF